MIVARLGIPILDVLDRLPGEEFARLVAAANRARIMEALLTRIAFHASDKCFADVRKAFEGAPGRARAEAPDGGEEHAEFLEQVRNHFAQGKS